MKTKGKSWTRDQVVRWCQKAVVKQEAKTKSRPGGAKLIKFIEGQIKKSDRAPANWNQVYRKARLEAGGIKTAVKEKAKKSKFKAGWWLLVLIIAIPVLVILFVIFTRDKGEGDFELGKSDEPVDLKNRSIEGLIEDFGYSTPKEGGENEPGRPFD